MQEENFHQQHFIFISVLSGVYIFLKMAPFRRLSNQRRLSLSMPICDVYTVLLGYFHSLNHHRLESWSQRFLLSEVLERYAEIIYNWGASLQN